MKQNRETRQRNHKQAQDHRNQIQQQKGKAHSQSNAVQQHCWGRAMFITQRVPTCIVHEMPRATISARTLYGAMCCFSPSVCLLALACSCLLARPLFANHTLFECLRFLREWVCSLPSMCFARLLAHLGEARLASRIMLL